jgi:hypothetical protein
MVDDDEEPSMEKWERVRCELYLNGWSLENGLVKY